MTSVDFIRRAIDSIGDPKIAAAARSELDSLERDHDRAREASAVLRDERAGSVWIWQGDGEDHPESLACPVLIKPDQLRQILGRRDETEAIIRKVLGEPESSVLSRAQVEHLVTRLTFELHRGSRTAQPIPTEV